MNKSLRKWSWIIAGILAVIAIFYCGRLITILNDFGGPASMTSTTIFSVVFSISSAAAPFLAMLGLAKRWRPLYLVSAIWFLVLTMFFGTITHSLLDFAGENGSLWFLVVFIPCVLCAALSYLQGRLYWVGRSAAATDVTT